MHKEVGDEESMFCVTGRKRRRPAVYAIAVVFLLRLSSADVHVTQFMHSMQKTQDQMRSPGERILVQPPPVTQASIRGRSAASSHVSSAPGTTSSRASTVTSQTSAQEVESLRTRIRELEEQLSRAAHAIQPSASTPDSNIETTSSRLSGIFHVHREVGQVKTRSVTHKRRLFGQSHWYNTIILFQDIWETTEPQLREENSKAFADIQQCKQLARVIKSRRAPPWPLQPTNQLPPKDIADELVHCYCRTTETVFRVLHIPTFKRDYEALWVSGGQPDTGFLMQLKLVLAIGAAVYDEKYTLRSSALRWVYEAETWVSEPKFKSRLDIQSLQTHILLLLAREIVGIGGDSVWFAAGALFRKAIYLGLHRDPHRLPNQNTYTAEMRRRLWNTILEIALQSSLTSGGPPLLSVGDFDTESPANFDDDQLVAEHPVPKPDDEFTDVSVSISLRKTFPIRLAVAKFLNDLGSSGTYEETLRLDAELRASYRTLCRTLQKCSSNREPPPPQFAIQTVDFLMRGYLSALHMPFFGPSLHGTAYAFSRKVVVENSLKIWYLTHPSGTSSAHPQIAQDHSDTDLVRLVVCGAGVIRILSFQAVFSIAAELRAQIYEDDGLNPLPLRQDLLQVIRSAQAWCFRWVEAGETNTKGYLLTCALAAQIEGLLRGLRGDDIPPLLIKAVEEAEEKCLPVLEEMAAVLQIERAGDAVPQIYMNPTPDLSEDCDFMMSDIFRDPGSMGSMWLFDVGAPVGPAIW
ncbi:fungal specific transcription factor domain-containing protein [Aspergillus thermomutatus]|uniref:Xylanolytic transcriptional activator regulatory domain-containing protein n=1 Tax=Aspergillus thermomutatus TaxID=41047 RepID=A0A397H9S0_ASPTH|nr:uncharacterized protein CDV56_101517 [Aspergillus thermomutatus]RHZ58376.1 hypothetical protein CDV56_101517 [Aspergillus thermomutatus]